MEVRRAALAVPWAVQGDARPVTCRRRRHGGLGASPGEAGHGGVGRGNDAPGGRFCRRTDHPADAHGADPSGVARGGAARRRCGRTRRRSLRCRVTAAVPPTRLAHGAVGAASTTASAVFEQRGRGDSVSPRQPPPVFGIGTPHWAGDLTPPPAPAVAPPPRRGRARWTVLVVVAALIGALVGGGIVAATDHGGTGGSTTVNENSIGPALLNGTTSIETVIAKVLPAVVSIDATSPAPSSGGSSAAAWAVAVAAVVSRRTKGRG